MTPIASATRPPATIPTPAPTHIAAVCSNDEPSEYPAACMIVGSQVLMPKTSSRPQKETTQNSSVAARTPGLSRLRSPSRSPVLAAWW